MRSLLTALTAFSLAPLIATAPSSNHPSCSPDLIKCNHIPGIKILSLTANAVTNYSTTTFQNGDTPSANWTGLDFCNVTVTYTHPHHNNDRIVLSTWLPPKDDWNGRFQGVGGGGYIAGWGPQGLAPAVAAGYAASSTDAGVVGEDASGWALGKDGEVDGERLRDFAYVSLGDLATIGKAVTDSYYGEAPRHSYWTGCSTGGRQGMELAQRFPGAFDGILAAAPAINWPSFQVADVWAQVVMHALDYYPLPCELEFLTAAVVEACDGLDGLSDGVVSRPDLCQFSVQSLVGEKNGCPGKQNTVTTQAAQIAEATWKGPITPKGEPLYPGLHQDAPISGLPGLTLANTNCTSPNRSSCSPSPFPVGAEWISYFLKQDPTFNPSTLSKADFTKIFHRSLSLYQNIIGTANPDLSAFKSHGGKILSWQGMADQLVPPAGTAAYYDSVLALDPAAAEFYRLFFAPGTYHCVAGLAPYPYDSLDVLVRWVERGEVPETLNAVNRTVDGDGARRPLCPYPRVQVYVGGDGGSVDSFSCA